MVEDHLRSGRSIQVLPMDVAMIEAVAELHMAASPAYMSSHLGSRYVRRVMRWFATHDSAVALVAVQDERKVVGYVVGAPDGYAGPMSRELVPVALLGVLQRPTLLFDARVLRTVVIRLGSMLLGPRSVQSRMQQADPAMSLVGIGVSPDLRRAGVAKRLIADFERYSTARGMNRLRLSVYPNNHAARELYEKCGWIAGPAPKRADQAMYYMKSLQ